MGSNRSQLEDLQAAVDTKQIWARLYELAQETIPLHRELADLVATEREGRLHAYMNSQEKSATARDQEAQYQLIGATTEIIKLKGEIAALNEERDFLKELWQVVKDDGSIAGLGT